MKSPINWEPEPSLLFPSCVLSAQQKLCCCCWEKLDYSDKAQHSITMKAALELSSIYTRASLAPYLSALLTSD